MILKSAIRTFSHIIIWCIILLVPVYFMTRAGAFDSRPYYHYLLKVGIIGILFYINYLYLIEKLLFNKKFVTYIVVNIILIGLLIGAQALISDLIFSPPHGNPRMGDRPVGPRPPFFMRIISDYLLIIFVIALSVAIKMTTRWHRDSINLEKVKAVQFEADLRNLRTQLNPHFLFNTLNNIYSLIAVDKDKAQDSVHRLSNLLRYILYDNDHKFVPVDKELQFTRNYIDLMKLRLSPNVKLDVLIDSNNDTSDLVASLMFITLIENAFKHGINNDGNSFIDINILVEKGKGILCTVENSLNNSHINKEEKNSGIGLANLSKRLELLYPGKHEFSTERRDNSFIARLRIDFSVNQ